LFFLNSFIRLKVLASTPPLAFFSAAALFFLLFEDVFFSSVPVASSGWGSGFVVVSVWFIGVFSITWFSIGFVSVINSVLFSSFFFFFFSFFRRSFSSNRSSISFKISSKSCPSPSWKFPSSIFVVVVVVVVCLVFLFPPFFVETLVDSIAANNESISSSSFLFLMTDFSFYLVSFLKKLILLI